MTLAVSITIEDVYTKLRTLVLDVVPVGTEVVQGLGNGVPMPAGSTSSGFVAMTANLFNPHRTPQESWDRVAVNPTQIAIEQGTLIRVQLDCYGPLSANWAVMLMTILRSDYGVRLLGPDVTPLYADNPMQAALINGEELYEQRWIVGANLQYNPVIMTAAEFAATLEVDIIEVDEAYPT